MDTSRSFVEQEGQAAAFGLHARSRPLPSHATGLDRDQLPSAGRLDAMFTGWREQDRWKGAEICLHADDVPERKIAPAVYDVDSFLHITRDPSDFKGPLQICLSPQPNRLLSKSIHVKVPISVGGKNERVPIHKIPHLVLAHERFTVIYILFPRLYTGQKKASVHLRDEQHALFFEGVIRPSFERIGMHFEHHLPGNYSSVRSASHIAAEATGSSAVRGGSVEVSYNKENLAELWGVMREVLRDADRGRASDGFGDEAPVDLDIDKLWQFGDPIFLLNRKDTKLLYKTDHTISSAVDGFWEQNKRAVDPYIRSPDLDDDDSDYNIAGGSRSGTDDDDDDDRTQLLDVASEFVPTRNGFTVLARRCCQHNTMLFLHGEVKEALFGSRVSPSGSPSAEDRSGEEEYRDEPDPGPIEVESADGWKAPRIPLSVTAEYPIHLLRDAVSLTCEPTKTSAPFKNGLYYTQSYSILKTIFTRANIWAFSNDEIFNLGHGTDVWNTLARTGKIKQDRAGGDRSLLKSCERMTAAFQDLGRGYGCRLEFRITQRLAQGLKEAEASWWQLVRRTNSLPAHNTRGTRGPRRLVVHPDRNAFFVVEAREFNLFLQGNIEKHLRLMDYIRSYYSRDSWSPQAAASLYAVVVAALQEFTMRHEVALTRVLTAPLAPAQNGRSGLGMYAIMERRGFAFFPEGVVDWQWLKLQDWATDTIRVPTLVVRAHWRELETLKESRHLFDQVVALALGPGIRTSRQAEDVLGVMAQLMILEYKKAAFSALFRYEAHDIGAVKFTLAGLDTEATRQQGRPLEPVKGNRRELKTVSMYFDWAWTESANFRDRKHLNTARFRTMAKMARDALDRMRQNEYVSADRLMAILYYRFSQQITCFPNPDKYNGCLSVTNTSKARSVICTEIRIRDPAVPRNARLTDVVAEVVRQQSALAEAITSPYPSVILGSIDQVRRFLRVE
jgi:hypothetical protein